MRYADFRPSRLDRHISLEDREDWLVVPCTHNRDSDLVEESNFSSALEMLGGESETVEVHRFGHWGPGWYEIILVHPARESEVTDIEKALAEYPVLDETDLGFRELDAESDAWVSYGAEETRRKLVRIFGLAESTANWFTTDRLYRLYGDYSSGTEHLGTEVRFPDSWIEGFRLSRDDLAKWIRAERKVERKEKINQKTTV